MFRFYCLDGISLWPNFYVLWTCCIAVGSLMTFVSGRGPYGREGTHCFLFTTSLVKSVSKVRIFPPPLLTRAKELIFARLND